MATWFRAARDDDADLITRVFLTARREAMPYLPIVYDEDQTRWWIREIVIKSGGTIVAIEKDLIVGFAVQNDGWLEHLYVLPEKQSRGIGSMLLSKIKQLDLETIKLRVFQDNVRARSFYEHLGFALIELCDGSDNEEKCPDTLYGWKKQQRFHQNLA